MLLPQYDCWFGLRAFEIDPNISDDLFRIAQAVSPLASLFCIGISGWREMSNINSSRQGLTIPAHTLRKMGLFVLHVMESEEAERLIANDFDLSINRNECCNILLCDRLFADIAWL